MMNFAKIHINIYKLENKISKIDTKKSIYSIHLNKLPRCKPDCRQAGIRGIKLSLLCKHPDLPIRLWRRIKPYLLVRRIRLRRRRRIKNSSLDNLIKIKSMFYCLINIYSLHRFVKVFRQITKFIVSTT